MRVSLPAVLVLALFVSGCSGGAPPAPAPMPPPTPAWSAVPREPDWVSAFPEREGFLRLVQSGRSNLVDIATSGADRGPGVMAERVRKRLATVLAGDVLEAAVAAAEAATTPVWRSYHHRTIDPRPVPGNTLCDAWALWEVSIDVVLEALPPESRDAARAALD